MRASVVSTIITPATSPDLIDLATVKDELAMTTPDAARDAVLGRYISALSAAAAQFCGRTLVKERIEDRFDLCREARLLQLTRWPVVQIVSVSEDETPLAAEAYSLNSGAGQIGRVDSSGAATPWCASAVVVRYDAGYSLDKVPADLSDAMVRAVGQRWFARGRDPMLRSEIVEGVSQFQYWVQTGASEGCMFAPDVQAILSRYRAPGIL